MTKRTRRSIFFISPGQIEVREEELPNPGPNEVQVRTLLSAISPGTERLVFLGQFPKGMQVDESIASLSGEFRYPLKYGYSTVGQVVELGAEVSPEWKDRIVFAFQPHTSAFLAAPAELHPLPEGISPQDAVFLPNIETALNLVMDGRPLIGERVLVFGQGVVGLLTTSLLAQYPLDSLISFDRFPLRQRTSREMGAQDCLDPTDAGTISHLEPLLPGGADLVFELSGSPAALDDAIRWSGFGARVVIGSWYGEKRASLDLGGHFHRSRIRLISSQVSTLAPELSGRWSKQRRFQVAWEQIRIVKPARLITQQVPIGDAEKAYQLIDQHPEETIQVILTYEGEK